ncbi:kinase-like protein [Polyporus arcularius HHB13444]|uniref:Kinase-like protein n=1 Tax=Polyporus arcularius HHB13444 TaxID=1314778 RepID=A0A5C3PL56_9APHY|nr:kinase-like protein [Polyporus arcularius HHB13444]
MLAIKIFRLGIEGYDDAAAELRIYDRLRTEAAEEKCPARPFATVLDAGIGPMGAFIAMPLLDATLEDIIFTPDIAPICTSDVRIVLDQLLRGIRYLHTNALIHTDIKSANVMLKSKQPVHVTSPDAADVQGPQTRLSDVNVYIIDLCGCVSSTSCGYGMIGSEHYRPPEVTLGQHNFHMLSHPQANVSAPPGMAWDAAVDSFGLGKVPGAALWSDSTGDIVVPRRSARDVFRMRKFCSWPTIEGLASVSVPRTDAAAVDGNHQLLASVQNEVTA